MHQPIAAQKGASEIGTPTARAQRIVQPSRQGSRSPVVGIADKKPVANTTERVESDGSYLERKTE